MRPSWSTVALIIISLFSPTAWAVVFSPETFMLKNGMKVVVVNNARVPVVTHMVWYKVGSADEGPGESGVAHFLEHLMFKGTKTRKPGEFSQIVARNGGRENAFTSYDYTAYFQTISSDKLETVMELEADRMTNLVITPKEVEPERQVVLEERRSRTDNNPGTVLGEHIAASLFLNHPYRNPIIGWEHDIRALDIDGVLAFYKRFYQPNNAILVVVGDITAAKLKPLAEKYYGAIPPGLSVGRNRAKEPPQKSARRVIHSDKRVRQPSWRRTYVAPSLLWGEKKYAYPLQVLADVIGGGASSRLYRKLVVEDEVAVSAGAYYSGAGNGPGRFTFYASPRGDVSLEALEANVEKEIEKLVKNGITGEELRRAKSRMHASAVYARDSLSGAARSLGSSLAVGIPVVEVEAWPERIEAVTLPQILEAAASTFNEQRSVTGLLLPKVKP